MSVLTSPKDFDFFTLDGDRSPGLAVITSGGDRKIEIADQGQLLTRGKNTVVRSIENIVVTYGFRLGLGATAADREASFKKRDAWIAMLEEGARRASVRVYSIVDLNMPWLKKVCLQGFKPQTPLAPGGPWDWQLVLHEYNRIKPFGGPLAPTTVQGAKNAALNKEAADLSKQIAARQSARRAGP